VDRSWAVPAAAGLLTIENLALLGALLVAGRAPAGVELALVVKFPLCFGLLQRRPGAFLALTLWEVLLVVLSLMNPSLSVLGRLLVFTGGAAGLTLLGIGLPAFPTRLPERP